MWMYVYMNLIVESNQETPDKDNKSSYYCNWSASDWFVLKQKIKKGLKIHDIMLKDWS